MGDWEMYQYKNEPKSLWFNSVTNTLTETPPQEVHEGPIIVYTRVSSSPFYTPFRHLYYHIYTPMYTRYTSIHTIFTPLNTFKHL